MRSLTNLLNGVHADGDARASAYTQQPQPPQPPQPPQQERGPPPITTVHCCGLTVGQIPGGVASASQAVPVVEPAAASSASGVLEQQQQQPQGSQEQDHCAEEIA